MTDKITSKQSGDQLTRKEKNVKRIIKVWYYIRLYPRKTVSEIRDIYCKDEGECNESGKDLEKKREALRKQVERSIKLLKKIGMVREVKDKKYEAVDDYFIYDTDESYKASLEHSKKILVGIVVLVESNTSLNSFSSDPLVRKLLDEELTLNKLQFTSMISELKEETPVGKLKEYAKEHLETGYPDLYKKLQRLDPNNGDLSLTLKKKRSELIGQTSKLLSEHIKDDMFPQEYLGDKAFYLKNIAEYIFDKDKIPESAFMQHTPSDEIISLYSAYCCKKGYEDAVREAINNEILPEIKECQEAYKNLKNEIEKLSNQLREELNELIIKVRGGQPLSGFCKACPAIAKLNLEELCKKSKNSQHSHS